MWNTDAKNDRAKQCNKKEPACPREKAPEPNDRSYIYSEEGDGNRKNNVRRVLYMQMHCAFLRNGCSSEGEWKNDVNEQQRSKHACDHKGLTSSSSAAAT